MMFKSIGSTGINYKHKKVVGPGNKRGSICKEGATVNAGYSVGR